MLVTEHVTTVFTTDIAFEIDKYKYTSTMLEKKTTKQQQAKKEKQLNLTKYKNYISTYQHYYILIWSSSI